MQVCPALRLLPQAIRLAASRMSASFPIMHVEVKTRRNRLFGEPEESVDYRKLRNLKAAINHYVKYRRIDNEIRFDIITVVGTIGSEPEIDHLIDVPL